MRARVDAALLAAAPDRGQGGQPGVRDARRAVGLARRHQAVPPARQQAARATPSTAGPRASRRRPARSGRASRPASAWRSPAQWLAAHFNRPGFELFDYDVYALARRRLHDGGHLRRGRLARRPPRSSSNLCWIYDNNQITIEGDTELAFTEDVADALHRPTAGTSRASATPTTSTMLDARVRRRSRTTTDRPTLIIVDSHIGYGSPHKQDTHAAHGEPLGDDEIARDQAALRLARGREVPRARRRAASTSPTASARAASELRARVGGELYDDYAEQYPQLADELDAHAAARAARRLGRATCPTFPADAKGAGRPRGVGQGAERARAERCRG